MHPLNCFILSVLLMIADGLIVHGPSSPLVAPLGSSVVLPCYVGQPLPVEGLKLEWRRTDSEALVHLYQDGESRSEAQQQDYHNRAHFFTEEIQHGNFSLLLNNLRAQDEGRYTCRAYSQQDSGETVVQIKDFERLLVSGSDESVFAYVGEDVTLNCSVDSHILPKHIEEVLWKKTDKDGDITVLLYQDNQIFLDSSDERYRGRIEFFTSEIPKGNFSLRLKSVRTEDKGVYICQVIAGGASSNATAELGRLRFSTMYTMMLILCISAFVSALLLFCLIYCRCGFFSKTQPQDNSDSIFLLQMLLVFCPNILMFIAFVLWGVTEGFLLESVTCSALYFLRPFKLLWVAPYVNDFTGSFKLFVESYSFRAEYMIFATVFNSVLFKFAWDKSLQHVGFEAIVIEVIFAMVFLLNVIYIIVLVFIITGNISQQIKTTFRILARISFHVLPSIQFILLFFTFGSIKEGFFLVAALPVFLTVTRHNWEITCGTKMGCSHLTRRLSWFLLMLLVNSTMFYFYIRALESAEDRVGWACLMAFLQLLWAVKNFAISFETEYALHRVVPVYVFGSVGVVLLNSVTLMAELILKTANGVRSIGDLRIVVFSSEFIFTFILMILLVFEPWIKDSRKNCQESCLATLQPEGDRVANCSQIEAESDKPQASGSKQKQETKTLTQDQEAGNSGVTEETPLNSVESQT